MRINIDKKKNQNFMYKNQNFKILEGQMIKKNQNFMYIFEILKG